MGNNLPRSSPPRKREISPKPAQTVKPVIHFVRKKLTRPRPSPIKTLFNSQSDATLQTSVLGNIPESPGKVPVQMISLQVKLPRKDEVRPPVKQLLGMDVQSPTSTIIEKRSPRSPAMVESFPVEEQAGKEQIKSATRKYKLNRRTLWRRSTSQASESQVDMDIQTRKEAGKPKVVVFPLVSARPQVSRSCSPKSATSSQEIVFTRQSNEQRRDFSPLIPAQPERRKGRTKTVELRTNFELPFTMSQGLRGGLRKRTVTKEMYAKVMQ